MIMRSVISTILIFFLTPSFSMAPKLNWDKAVDHAIIKYGLRTEPELVRFFANANIAYPPREVALLAFKKERHVELWAKNENQNWRFIHTYPLTAFSGRLGPKLKERDGQIPEGIYRLTTFNPFSSMHLSMMINYPNNYDRLQAIKDGRRRLGNNIFLHGKSVSVGCLAVGDKAIDQLFLLTRRVGLNHVKIIIAPNDLRKGKPATSTFAQPRWLPDLYKQITTALNHFPHHRIV
ncbi:Legionella secretion system protein A [Legionella drozanskii LLAP-1]|uniref:Legionella secretion system protein A n=2 Tax=Legionellaceae TaxID=444 RepID=A0A0W0TDM5_9GAMM|nr:Legionella secretion system protein A [Legionella drozanskii LLAP-1]